MDTTEQIYEPWQVEANGKIFDTHFAEMTTWIDEGALLRHDKVRKGNLRWIEASKVPSLMAVFNAKDNGQPLPPPIITTTKLGPTTMPGDSPANTANYAAPPVTASISPSDPTSNTEPFCSVHPDVRAAYICETCANQFCGACPNRYGSVKICPFCGAMCHSLAQVEKTRTETGVHSQAIGEGFGFGDFARALAYPFRFKTSLILGALMFMIFSLGQSVVGFGGIFMLGGAIFCFMLANTLTFGILANTADNFSQGKIGLNFMPSFEDFSVWDDVFHPFFLSIGVYIASFGPLIAVVIVAFFMVMGAVAPEMNGLQADAARSVSPQLPYAANAAKQSEKVREILNKDMEQQKQRVAEFEAHQERVMAAVESGTELNEKTVPRPLGPNELDEERVADLEKMIGESRKAQLESVIGRTPETVAKDREAMFSKILGYGIAFILIGGICLLWGLFYFPAASIVAAYTRSFRATLNPSVGFDTIRRLGGDYFKILLMGLVVTIMAAFIGFVLGALFAPFDLPGVGNLPAKAIGSLFGFYLSVVFSCVIGFALYKNADRLHLFKA